MTVDLSRLCAGDTVYFRCGGKAVVDSIIPPPEPGCFHKIFFVGYAVPYFFRDCENRDGLFDIIRVEPAFRWEDIRPGMAFKYDDPDTGETNDAYFVCIASSGEPCFSIEGFACPQYLCKYVAKNIRPNPEHDIEVAG